MVKNDENIIEKKIKKTIEKYNLIEKGDKIVLGVSGGPDSMCMLDIFNKMIKNNTTENLVIENDSSEGVSPVAKKCQKGASPLATPLARKGEKGGLDK